MEIYEITQIYGSGPFGHAGATKVFVTETIESWLAPCRERPRRHHPRPVRDEPLEGWTISLLDTSSDGSTRGTIRPDRRSPFEALYRRFPQVEGAAV